MKYIQFFIPGILSSLLFACNFSNSSQPLSGPLTFDPKDFSHESLVLTEGDTIFYKAYKDLTYVENVEDSVYQKLNIFIPDSVIDNAPILLRTYIGGYMASKPQDPRADDATGYALKEGYVVCIPGSRGANSFVTNDDGYQKYTGKAPNALLDLKAAVRYLRRNGPNIPASTDRIFVDGTSAGGAMAALLGSTGNCDLYEDELTRMGTANEKDDVYAVISYCPITDLNHADMEYEWLYGCTNKGARHLDEAQIAISNELASLCPDYIDSLFLRNQNGEYLTTATYKTFLKSFLIASAQKAIDSGLEIHDEMGYVFTKPDKATNTDKEPARYKGKEKKDSDDIRIIKKGDVITDLNLDKYLEYIAREHQLKTPPAFDQWMVLIPVPSPENQVFGTIEGEPANFTEFSLRHHLHDSKAKLSEEMDSRVKMMNPMDFIGLDISTISQYWYIRHGAKDRDTSFLVPINLATKLENNEYEVNFFIPWDRPHSGDYDLDDLFEWIEQIR